MERKGLIKTALILSIITILYNIGEGAFSIFFGASDDTLALLGFGIDSFVEVISGIGILHMVIRMNNSEPQNNGCCILSADSWLNNWIGHKCYKWHKARNHHCRDYHFIGINCHNVLFDESKTQRRKETKLKRYYRRCELHKNLFLPIIYSFGFKSPI